jgi:hypothetical protein
MINVILHLILVSFWEKLQKSFTILITFSWTAKVVLQQPSRWMVIELLTN